MCPNWNIGGGVAGYSAIEVWDAAELDARSRISRRLPPPNDVHSYVLRDPAPRPGQQFWLTRHVIHQLGDLQLSRVSDRLGTRIRIGDPGMDYHCFVLPRAGRMSILQPGTADATEVHGIEGAIHRGRPGTQATTADGTVRLNLWVSTLRLEATLASCLQGTLRAPLTFTPRLDWSRGCGAALRRLVLHLAEELAAGGGIAGNPAAVAAFTDLFIHTALRGLPHNYSERLAHGAAGPTPRILRRAEEYLREHAAEPVRMEQVAQAAGCSLRTLQLAFRRFRESTPHAALRDARLDGARRDLASGNDSVAVVSRRWGFTNAGRFTAAYLRRFGERPVPAARR